MTYQSFRLVQDILEQHACSQPDKLALICQTERLTYAQLDDIANRMAAALADEGVCRADRIILYLPNSVELVASIFAVLKANAVFSVVDYAVSAAKLKAIIANSGAVGFITHELQAELAAELLNESPSLKFAVLSGADTAPTKANAHIRSYDAIQAACSPIAPPRACVDGDLAYLLYTSGSTGTPKGVMTTHRSSLFAVEIAIEYLGLSEDDIIASPLPLSYSHGFNQLLKTFRAGATLLLEKSFAFPSQTLKRIEAECANRFAGVPTTYQILLQQDLTRYDLSCLRYLSSAGAPLAPATIQQIREKFPQAALFSIYGMAEASNALGLDPTQIETRSASVGKAFPGTEVWLQNDRGERLGPNQTGELVVRGGHVRSGYWHDPETSAQRFYPGALPGEQVCHTGDLFKMDAQGFFYFVGRGDEIIKSGGKKIVPKEVEAVLYALDGVQEAAVIAIADEVLGQAAKAVVALNPQRLPPLCKDEILAHCHQFLDEYQVPRQVEIRESLPKTPSGKIIKSALS